MRWFGRGGGLFGALVCSSWGFRGLAETVRLDWVSQTLTIRRRIWSKRLSFQSLTNLELIIQHFQNANASAEATGETMEYLAVVAVIRPAWRFQRVHSIVEFIGADGHDPQPEIIARAVAAELARTMGLDYQVQRIDCQV